jgi:hypothetical protein
MTDAAAVTEPAVLYLEPDDEIPSVARRLREADATRVVLVAPGRTKATSSAIGLRLLARHAADAGREISLVAEPATRSLANEAGIAAFASVAEAQASGGQPPAPGESVRPRASIHVVRGERAGLAALAAGPATASALGALVPPSPMGIIGAGRMEETQAVPVVAPAPPRARVARPRPRRTIRIGRATAIAIVASMLVAAGVVAAVMPSASVTIVPTVTEVGPVTYSVELPAQQDSGSLTVTQTGRATGKYTTKTPAQGVATFINYGGDPVEVPAGTAVSAGDQAFTTDAQIVVPAAFLLAGKESVAVTATAAGPDGNVGAHEIDTIQNKQLARRLRASPLIIGRVVDNDDATAGGSVKNGPQVTQKDVDAAVTAAKTALQDKLAAAQAAHADRVYAPPSAKQEAMVTVPKNLVGTKDKETFELTGSLEYDQRYLTTDQLRQAGLERLTADSGARPARSQVVDDSIQAEATRLQASGDYVDAEIKVRGGVTGAIDTDQLRSRIAGLSRSDAERVLANFGTPTISLWPSWVDSIPRLAFRVQIALRAPSASPAAASVQSAATQ